MPNSDSGPRDETMLGQGPTIPVGSLRVLAVDDCAAQRRHLVELLSSLQVGEIGEAEDGVAALQVLARKEIQPDLILVDLHMPRMDGFELLRHLSTRRLRASVVVLSAAKGRVLTMADRLSKLHGLNLIGVLQKPLDREALATILHSIPLGQATPAGVDVGNTASAPEVTVAEVRWAIEHGELVLYYQPNVFVRTGDLAAVEALVRWNHPVHGLLPPSAFMGIAEKSGLMDLLTLEVFEAAVAQLSQWQRNGLSVDISVNISADSLARLRFPDELEELAAKYEVSPSSVTLEVTESRLVHDDRRVTETLARLSVKGFRLAIDDYGTGYASLQQLRRVPADELKLDRAFVHGASGDEAALAIQSSSAQLSKRLGFTLVAEGVETQEDWDQIASNRYDIGQGYFIARPMPADEFYRWARLRLASRQSKVA